MIYRYWGKTQRKAAKEAKWHLLVYHSLDVAAVGKVLLERHERLRKDLAKRLGLDEGVFLSWVVFFFAIHDLGKFAEGFQNLNQDVFLELHGRLSKEPYSVRHDSLGFLFWEQCLWHLLQNEEWLFPVANKRDQYQWQEGLAFWARAVTGHHGQPPKRRPNNSELILSHHFSATDQQAAIEFSRAVRELLLTKTLPVLPAAKAFKNTSKRISWWLAGIAVLADWIGSNAEYFPYRDAPIPLDDYWQEAQQKAVAAIEKAGVLPCSVSHGQLLGDLFPIIKSFPLTPLQQLAATLSLGDGPQLFILEDVTGAGKTEAAILLAHRLMSANLGSGIYVGLPTMATANAMYIRMELVYERLFADEARPSLVLAHSARHLSERFRKSILATDASSDSDYAQDEQSATARCTAWLADSRKRALLADMGIGTIDQALQAVLYSKHQSLRLLGLFGKVLMVDEVHACDAYMLGVLRKLLTFHATSGGSAILLSATLPRHMREALTEAFCEGGVLISPELVYKNYPLLTHIGGLDKVEYPVDTRPEVARRVDVCWVVQFEEVEALILAAAAKGRCLCWVRNTVADARAAYTALSKRLPKNSVHLFHARFAMGDRLDIEQQVIERFGKNSKAAQRAGQVVIATQVVEQSLDLDFDLLISDLAPIDLLIQRAGRLCRHTRDEYGNPITGLDRRGTPCLVVYGPEPIEDAPRNWFDSVFPKAAPVYPNHGQLWLTARLLWDHGGFRMPDDARDLIEGVYGELAEGNIPEPLLEKHWEVEGESMARMSLAGRNSIALEEGYTIDSLDWWSDAVTPTRLGEPTSTVRLARWDGRTLKPWRDGEFAWDLSQVHIRQTRIGSADEPADPRLKAALEGVKEILPDKGKWSVLLPLSEQDSGLWSGIALDGGGREVRIYYDARLGLLLDQEMERNLNESHP